MNSIDYLYGEIYRGSLQAGAPQNSAKNAAITGISEYKKGRYKSIKDLIETGIKNAKKRNY